MISISVSNLAFRTGPREILSGVTFSLEEGDRLAIVGVNGSGKSTLLRMICGEYPHDEGEIHIAKNKIVGMLHQDDAFNIIGSDGREIPATEAEEALVIKEENRPDASPIDCTVLGQMYAVLGTSGCHMLLCVRCAD